MAIAELSLRPSRLSRLTAPAKRLMVVALLNDFAVAAIAMGVQFLGIHLNASTQVLGILPALSAIAYTGMCLISGPLSDRWGRRGPAMLSCLITGVVWWLMQYATSPWHLLVLMPFSGGALALLWPSMQAWLGEFSGSNTRRLNRTLSLFNLSWSAGIMLGTLLAGWMVIHGYSWPFVISSALSFLSLAVLYLTPPGQSEDAPSPATTESVSVDKARLFLYLAWIGNFASWFCRGSIGAIFPKLGDTLGFSEPLISTLAFVPTLALCIMFGVARLSHRWQYHLRILLLVELFGIAGMLIVGRAVTPLVFTIGFALTGLCTAITYISSLTYALHGTSENRGKRSGLHEAVLGVGIIIGPLAAGFLGERLNLHAPFFACGVVFAAAMVAQIIVWLVMTRRRQALEVLDLKAAP
ncbi:MAG: MFS transporter [Armatimonadota bacterium]